MYTVCVDYRAGGVRLRAEDRPQRELLPQTLPQGTVLPCVVLYVFVRGHCIWVLCNHYKSLTLAQYSHLTFIAKGNLWEAGRGGEPHGAGPHLQLTEYVFFWILYCTLHCNMQYIWLIVQNMTLYWFRFPHVSPHISHFQTYIHTCYCCTTVSSKNHPESRP